MDRGGSWKRRSAPGVVISDRRVNDESVAVDRRGEEDARTFRRPRRSSSAAVATVPAIAPAASVPADLNVDISAVSAIAPLAAGTAFAPLAAGRLIAGHGGVGHRQSDGAGTRRALPPGQSHPRRRPRQNRLGRRTHHWSPRRQDQTPRRLRKSRSPADHFPPCRPRRRLHQHRHVRRYWRAWSWRCSMNRPRSRCHSLWPDRRLRQHRRCRHCRRSRRPGLRTQADWCSWCRQPRRCQGRPGRPGPHCR